MPFFHFPIPCSYRVRRGTVLRGKQYIGGTVLLLHKKKRVYFVIHSLMATVAADVGVGGVEFFMFYLLFLGTVLSLYVFVPPPK